MTRARALAKENKLTEALGTLMERRNAAGAGRERFLWQLGLCRLLIRAGHETLVAAHVKEVLEVLDEFKVERWEPDLAVEALILALKGLRGQEEADEATRERLAGRVALLDPVKALDLA